jgi:transcriptional regulator with XRE-family HTH domain
MESTLVIKPYQNTRLATFVTKRVLELKHKKTQSQIADQAGFSSVNMMSMLKSGASKLPLDRVPALAAALECDPAYLFKLAIEQLESPTTASAIDRIFGGIVTQNERDWL